MIVFKTTLRPMRRSLIPPLKREEEVMKIAFQ